MNWSPQSFNTWKNESFRPHWKGVKSFDKFFKFFHLYIYMATIKCDNDVFKNILNMSTIHLSFS